MAPGADKIIFFDPPGSIGLVDQDAVVMLRFDDTDSTARPRDEAGALQDLDILATGTHALTRPQVVNGSVGYARAFVPSSKTGLAARDVTPGASLLTRTMSIQAILRWDAAAQLAAGTPGTVICRGLGNATAEFVAYGLQISVVDAPSFTAQVQWFWQDIAGTLHVELGAQFVNAGAFTMLTATRRWISPTQVKIRYFVGDRLIGETISVDGSIGGGTTGVMQIGSRLSGGVDANFFAGAIDELMVLDRELCAEEIEATWLRITVYQPRGVQLYREMMDDGFPVSHEPDSDAQLEIRWVGTALGFVAAAIENMRANFLPQRAYGEVLEDWEQAMRVTAAPDQDDIDTRRQRVLARLRQRRGISTGGLQDALKGLLGGADPSQLQFIAFSNTIRDEFATLSTLRWDLTPTGCATAPLGSAHFAPAAGTYLAGRGGKWLSAAMNVSQSTIPNTIGQERALAKMTMTAPVNGVEIGVFFANRGLSNYILLGLRDNSGTFQVMTEVFTGWTSGGATIRGTIGANPAAIWLHLHQQADATWIAEWSTAGETSGYTASPSFAGFGSSPVHWAGFYFRSTGPIGGGAQADVDMFTLRTPNGTRPLNGYVLLDRALGFKPDIAGARSTIQAMAHGFTHLSFITNPVMLAGDPDSGAGEAPCGPVT